MSQLDSVIIAPPGPLEGDSQTLAHLQPAWEELEALVRSQKIAAIGTSDLDKDLLEQLYNWAQVGGNLVYVSLNLSLLSWAGMGLYQLCKSYTVCLQFVQTRFTYNADNTFFYEQKVRKQGHCSSLEGSHVGNMTCATAQTQQPTKNIYILITCRRVHTVSAHLARQ